MRFLRKLKSYLDINSDDQLTTVDYTAWGILFLFIVLLSFLFISTPVTATSEFLYHVLKLNQVLANLVAAMLLATLVKSTDRSTIFVDTPSFRKSRTDNFWRLLRYLDFDNDKQLSVFDIVTAIVVSGYLVVLTFTLILLFAVSKNLGSDCATLVGDMTRAASGFMTASYLKRTTPPLPSKLSPSRSVQDSPGKRDFSEIEIDTDDSSNSERPLPKWLNYLDFNKDGSFTAIDLASSYMMFTYALALIISFTLSMLSPYQRLKDLNKILTGYVFVCATLLIGVYFGDHVRPHKGLTKLEVLFHFAAAILGILFFTVFTLIFYESYLSPPIIPPSAMHGPAFARALAFELGGGMVLAIGQLLMGAFLKKRLILVNLSSPAPTPNNSRSISLNSSGAKYPGSAQPVKRK